VPCGKLATDLASVVVAALQQEAGSQTAARKSSHLQEVY
jgi:hypothetical protein